MRIVNMHVFMKFMYLWFQANCHPSEPVFQHISNPKEPEGV